MTHALHEGAVLCFKEIFLVWGRLSSLVFWRKGIADSDDRRNLQVTDHCLFKHYHVQMVYILSTRPRQTSI